MNITVSGLAGTLITAVRVSLVVRSQSPSVLADTLGWRLGPAHRAVVSDKSIESLIVSILVNADLRKGTRLHSSLPRENRRRKTLNVEDL